MTTIKEVLVQSIGGPACIKVERNSNGYNYEISIHSDNMGEALAEIIVTRKQIEIELYGTNPDAHPE